MSRSVVHINSSSLQVFIGGTLLLAIGSSVILGWSIQNINLIQVYSTFSPMQFNTALGFVSSGIALLVIRTNYGIAMACGIFTMLTGLLTLLEYVIGTNLGIDQLLLEKNITGQVSYPGRMAPNTALCFFFGGMALIGLSTPINRFSVSVFSSILGVIALGLSVIALLGYAVNLEAAYDWGAFPRMAIHTASGFIILNMTIICLAWQKNITKKTAMLICFPKLLSIFGGVVVIGLWLNLSSYQDILVANYGVPENGNLSTLNNMLLVVGLMFTFAFSYAVYLAQTARQRKQEIEKTNHKLTTEIKERKLTEDALRKSDARWQFALEGSQEGVWDWNIVTNEVFFSKQWKEMLGYQEGDFSNSLDEWDKRVHIDDKEQAYLDINAHFENKTPFYENEHRLLCKDDSYKWILARGKIVSWTDDGKPLRMIGTHTDITERKISEEQLRLSSRVFTSTNEGITITDNNGTIIDVNPAFCSITGYDRDEIIGKSPKILGSGRQGPEFYADMWKSINTNGYWQGEIWNRKKNGTLYAEFLTISSLLDKDGNVQHYVGMFSDITLNKHQQEKITLMAHYDVLTQLPNRILLNDRFTQAVAHSKRNKTLLAVCFLDLDNFKPVNDTYGLEVGDQLLIEVANRIKTNLRDEDTASRQSGDEFALLLGNIESFSHYEKMLDRILFSLSQPFLIEDQSISISASIGVSLYPIDNSDLDTLMRHADQAMYHAKSAGKNKYHLFNAEEDQQTIQKYIQLKEIETALLNNEFCLFYQPKVNMATGEVIGAEALIRWDHPSKGIIPPFKFLPIIEGTSLEVQVGDWVINEALKQLNYWKERGLEIEVSVNISSYHLQSPSFVAKLETALAAQSNVSSKYFQLEILESTALGDLNVIGNIIKACSNILGVNIALDDFGTGYSSLTHLKSLAVHTIKIDQTFVRDVLDDPNDYAIIDGVIGLANAFNREVIAEGVETTEHGLMLLIIGCNKAQGYGIARPMPAATLLGWVKSYKPNQDWTSLANEVSSPKQDKLNLFKLALLQWINKFETSIQSAPDTTINWPIISKKKCFCGFWINRVRQEQLFDDQWLQQIDEAHDSIHSIANHLFSHYQKGEIDVARNGLNELKTAVENLVKELMIRQ